MDLREADLPHTPDGPTEASDTSAMPGDLALARAKQPAALVAGPYGHPLHPSLVAVPIGAWVTAFVFDVRSLVGARSTEDTRAAGDAMAVGIVGALAAAAIGALDWGRLTPRTKARAYGSTHAILNIGVTAFYVAAWRRRAALAAEPHDDGGASGLTLQDVAANAAALGVLAFSGIIGGELAYRFGVRVADETTQRRGHVSAS